MFKVLITTHRIYSSGAGVHTVIAEFDDPIAAIKAERVVNDQHLPTQTALSLFDKEEYVK